MTLVEWLKASASEREARVAECLARIRAMDPLIDAWVQVSPQPPTGSGTLNGIPFGAKDIFETRGLATEYGSEIYKGRIGTEDAAIIRELRARGAVLLGKTRTTAFAYYTPAPTRNPHETSHTPGGSSSGSAAAVAAGMVPFALGSQTKGSILRPASFCGVTGFKPTYGLLPVEGVLPLAKSLDTIGLFTHTPADMLALWDAMGKDVGRDETFSFGVPDPIPDVEPAMRAAFGDTLSRLREAGAMMRSIDITDTLTKLNEASDIVMAYEAAGFHRERYEKYGSELAELADLVRRGLDTSAAQYDEARQFIDARKTEFSELFTATPVILTPAATGPAPRGLTSTGNPRMNAPWTALGTPAVSIPMPITGGLPLGLQVTADSGHDARVLRAAVELRKHL